MALHLLATVLLSAPDASPAATLRAASTALTDFRQRCRRLAVGLAERQVSALARFSRWAPTRQRTDGTAATGDIWRGSFLEGR